MKPLRFGIMPYYGAWEQPLDKWIKTAKETEKQGYSTIFQSDHFYKETLDPITMLTTAANHTTNLNIGTLVLDIDYRHPAILAKTAATLHLLSKGRFELGIGAGWDEKEYNWTGIPFDKPITRIRRLEEAVQVIKDMLSMEQSSFDGKHYHINDIPRAATLEDGDYPKIMIGGGGKQVLSVAGKYADIIGIHFQMSQRARADRKRLVESMSFDGVNRKIGYVLDAAESVGRDVSEIEFMILSRYLKIGDDVSEYVDWICNRFGVSVSGLNLDENAWMLVGSIEDVRDKIVRTRKETGVSYFVIGPEEKSLFKLFAEGVIKPLS